jgi:hypothetical protein
VKNALFIEFDLLKLFYVISTLCSPKYPAIPRDYSDMAMIVPSFKGPTPSSDGPISCRLACLAKGSDALHQNVRS